MHRVWEDTREYFDDLSLHHIYFPAVDLSAEVLYGGFSCGEARVEENIGGLTVIPASGFCFEDNREYRHRLGVWTHELGHNFGLSHDLQILHILLDCKRLGSKRATFSFAVKTAELFDTVMLASIDANGNITEESFHIELTQAVSRKNVLDVNNDGGMSLLDLTSIASRLGRRGKNSADVNKDSDVNILDLLLVAGVISSLPRQTVETFPARDVQKWLTDAKQHRIENEVQQNRIPFLNIFWLR